ELFLGQLPHFAVCQKMLESGRDDVRRWGGRAGKLPGIVLLVRMDDAAEAGGAGHGNIVREWTREVPLSPRVHAGRSAAWTRRLSHSHKPVEKSALAGHKIGR